MLQYNSNGQAGAVYLPESRNAMLEYPATTVDKRDCIHLSPCGSVACLEKMKAKQAAAAAALRYCIGSERESAQGPLKEFSVRECGFEA